MFTETIHSLRTRAKLKFSVDSFLSPNETTKCITTEPSYSLSSPIKLAEEVSSALTVDYKDSFSLTEEEKNFFSPTLDKITDRSHTTMGETIEKRVTENLIPTVSWSSMDRFTDNSDVNMPKHIGPGYYDTVGPLQHLSTYNTNNTNTKFNTTRLVDRGDDSQAPPLPLKERLRKERLQQKEEERMKKITSNYRKSDSSTKVSTLLEPKVMNSIKFSEVKR